MSNTFEVEPLVSIILPVHNGEQFLRKAIDSVCNQEYQNWELIIVNDFSSDCTASIISQYQKKDPRIIVITNKTNLRLPASLNRGIEGSKGKWITWTSDDNILLPECLKVLIESASKGGADFIYADYFVIDENDRTLRLSQTGPADLIYLENTIGACFLYRREIYETVGGYAEDKFLFEDYDYWVRIHRAQYVFEHIAKPLYKYRIHSAQLSNTNKLPKDFTRYRYGLVEFLDTSGSEFLLKGYLSTLHLAIKSREVVIGIKCILHLLRYPCKSLKLVIHKIRKRNK